MHDAFIHSLCVGAPKYPHEPLQTLQNLTGEAETAIDKVFSSISH